MRAANSAQRASSESALPDRYGNCVYPQAEDGRITDFVFIARKDADKTVKPFLSVVKNAMKGV